TGRAWSRLAGVGVVVVALCGNVNWYAGHTPSLPAQTIAARKQVYLWIKNHVPPRARLLSTNDPPRFQTFLYTGHPIRATQREAVAGKTYVVLRAGRRPARPQNYLTHGFATRLVYRNAVYAVVRLEGAQG